MPIAILRAPPSPITAAEHAQLTSSTPTSFADIPPVCHRKEDGVKVQMTPGIEGEDSWGDSEFIGTLFVASNALEFWSPSQSKGFSIPWPCVSLHAISRTSPEMPTTVDGAPTTNGDASPHEQQPCIYCQLDEALEQNLGDAVAEEEEEWGETRELFIVPSDPAYLDSLFAVFSECAAAFPSAEADGGDDGAIFDDADAEGEEDLSEAGRAALAHLDNVIDWSTVPRPDVDDDATADADE